MENDDLNQPLSDNPLENMRIENDILKLKMKAQYGDAFQMGSGNSDLPPEIENQFLNNILAFEEAHQRTAYKKVYELLGKPDFKNASLLSDNEISQELSRLQGLMAKHNIAFDVLATYDDRIIYSFITEELFDHNTEIGEGHMEGMITHFTYEEFHPNHKYDIDERAQEFLSGWFEQKFTADSWELGDEFILPNGITLNKQQVLHKIKTVFAAYPRFINCKYVIADIGFKLNEDSGLGMGHAEGGVKYDAILENGEQIHIEGPFKLYLSLEFEWWKILYFVFPGFEW